MTVFLKEDLCGSFSRCVPIIIFKLTSHLFAHIPKTEKRSHLYPRVTEAAIKDSLGLEILFQINGTFGEKVFS